MGLTTAQLIDELAAVAGTGARSGDPYRTSLLRYLNMAFRSIAYAYPWDSMRTKQVIHTVAPYATGTCSITQGSTALTGSGTTWTSGMVGRKFALSQGGPFYRILAYISGTSLTLADAYAETDATAATYVIYQDEYDLDAGTHAVEDVNVIWPTNWPVSWSGERNMDRADLSGNRTGQPCWWAQAPNTTVNTPRVRFFPVPDTIYRVEFRYQKSWTALTDGSGVYTTQGLPEDVEELALDRALRWIPRIEGSRRVMSDFEWRKALRDVWVSYRRQLATVGHRAGVGSGRQVSGVVLNLSGFAS